MEVVNGSKEVLVVDMQDLTEAVVDLSTASPVFYVENEAGTELVTAATATASEMRVSCLLDTTTGGPWINGLHKLYVGFEVGAEEPKLFAGTFYLI